MKIRAWNVNKCETELKNFMFFFYKLTFCTFAAANLKNPFLKVRR